MGYIKTPLKLSEIKFTLIIATTSSETQRILSCRVVTLTVGLDKGIRKANTNILVASD